MLFSDSFTGPDGSPPDGNFQVQRSASGAGAGATIQSNQLQLSPVLGSTQAGTWQYVQAREVSVQPSWSTGTVAFHWQMTTAANLDQTENFALAPAAATGNVFSAPDYLRVRVQNGVLAIVTRAAGGTATTLWSGAVPVSTTLNDFELDVDATNVSLYQGPAGAATLRAGPLPHGLTWTSGFPTFSATTDAAPVWNARFDSFEIDHL